MSTPEATVHPFNHLAVDQVSNIVRLVNTIWPKTDVSFEELVAMTYKRRGDNARRQFVVVWEGENPVASAETFPRTIKHSSGKTLEALGLAGVCVMPAHRGRGLGKLVVQKAFEQVDRGEYPLSLFQTGVPTFYRRLGAVEVNNTFENSAIVAAPERSLWWEPFVMVYPGTAAWPRDAIVDLNGPAY